MFKTQFTIHNPSLLALVKTQTRSSECSQHQGLTSPSLLIAARITLTTVSALNFHQSKPKFLAFSQLNQHQKLCFAVDKKLYLPHSRKPFSFTVKCFTPSVQLVGSQQLSTKRFNYQYPCKHYDQHSNIT